MPGWAWLVFLIVALPLLVFIPTHFCLCKLSPKPATPKKSGPPDGEDSISKDSINHPLVTNVVNA